MQSEGRCAAVTGLTRQTPPSPAPGVSGRTPSSLTTVVPLASAEVSLFDVLGVLLGYPADTVRFYDFAGTDSPQTSTEDRVTLTDLGRVTLMNPRISGADAARLLSLDVHPALWAAVPQDADLAAADPAVCDDLYDAAKALHDAHRVKGVKNAKVGKLMQLKRPALFPVLDAQFCALYREQAAVHARRPELAWRGFAHSYWSAVRSDLMAWRSIGAFDVLRSSLQDTPRQAWTRLTDLRMIDITAWTYGASVTGAKRASRRLAAGSTQNMGSREDPL